MPVRDCTNEKVGNEEYKEDGMGVYNVDLVFDKHGIV